MRVAVEPIPAGVPGTRATIARMDELVRSAIADQEFRAFAVGLTQHLHPRDVAGQIATAFRLASNDVREVRDPHDLETVQSPQVTAQILIGDCDDKVVLLAALLRTLGRSIRYVTLARQPGRYSHVYLEVLFRGRWIALDPIEPTFEIGDFYDGGLFPFRKVWRSR